IDAGPVFGGCADLFPQRVQAFTELSFREVRQERSYDSRDTKTVPAPSPLAVRAVEGRPVRQHDALDQGTAHGAGERFPPVNAKLRLEAAPLAAGVPIVAERRPARRNGLPEDVPERVPELRRPFAPDPVRPAGRPDPRAE